MKSSKRCLIIGFIARLLHLLTQGRIRMVKVCRHPLSGGYGGSSNIILSMLAFLIMHWRRQSLVVLDGLVILRAVFTEDGSSLCKCKHLVLDLVKGIDKLVLDCFLLEPEALMEVVEAASWQEVRQLHVMAKWKTNVINYNVKSRN